MNTIKNLFIGQNQLKCQNCYEFLSIQLSASSNNKFIVKCNNCPDKNLTLVELLSLFQSNNKKSLKHCKECEKAIVNKSFLCHNCKEILCDKCEIFHLHNGHNENENIDEIGNKCFEHKFPYQFFCINCQKHLCKNCKNSHAIPHDIIKIQDKMKSNDEINELENRIKREENDLNKEMKFYNILIQMMNSKFSELIDFKNKSLDFKNSIYQLFLLNDTNNNLLNNLSIINQNLNQQNDINTFDIENFINNVNEEANDSFSYKIKKFLEKINNIH